MLLYKKISEIDLTATTIEDTALLELEYDDNSYNITGENAKKSVLDYVDSLATKSPVETTDSILIRDSGVSKNTTLAILKTLLNSGSILSVDGSITSSYSIDSTDDIDAYYFDVQENQKLPVSLDAPSTLPGKEIEIVYDSTNYGTLPITSTGANIRCKGAKYTTICLFTEGETIKLRSDGTYWNVVNGWKFDTDTGWIYTTAMSSRVPGSIDLVLNDSTGFVVWDIFEESVSGFRGIVAGISGNTIIVWRTDGGFFTNGRTITVISGGSVSDTVNGNTVGIDSNLLHNQGVDLFGLKIKFFGSDDGTNGNSFEVGKGQQGGGECGWTPYQVSTDIVQIYGGIAGLNIIDDGTKGGDAHKDTVWAGQNWYYRQTVDRR